MCRRRRSPELGKVLLLAALAGHLVVAAQGGGVFSAPVDHPSIQYSTRPTHDAVALLNQKLQNGTVTLAFDDRFGYLRSVLSALDIPIESQTLVYSPTSAQSDHISESSPRAVYFNDRAAVGWVDGGDVLEVAAVDPQQSAVFWTLEQKRQSSPRLTRQTQCLECHLSASTNGVPGLLVMSTLPLSDNPHEYAQGWAVDDRTPIEDRWGGWYVTGSQVPARHLGNVPVNHVARSYARAPVAPALSTIAGRVKSDYLTPYSDVVALLVMNHQARMTDLIARLGWESRVGDVSRVNDAVEELADYMLFVDETRLPTAVKGSSGFAELFSKAGPRDSKGRSLRDLDLGRRLLRYRCSYMIYSPAFDALPASARELVYARMWNVLSRMPDADRGPVVDILRETKNGLPDFFKASAH